MPTSDAILAGLTAIANDWRLIAVAWHVGFGIGVLAVLSGWRSSNRVAGYLLAMPLLSVGVAAWASGNPFNGAVFVGLFLYLLIVVTRMPTGATRIAPPTLLVPGMSLAVFGWFYPHFLATDRWIAYAYAAPLGLLPCPTLSAVIGITLILDFLGSRSWALTLAAAGLVYGVIGVFALGVMLDYALVAGALAALAALATSAAVLERPGRTISRIGTS
jgi:hypothetical protein